MEVVSVGGSEFQIGDYRTTWGSTASGQSWEGIVEERPPVTATDRCSKEVDEEAEEGLVGSTWFVVLVGVTPSRVREEEEVSNIALIIR